MLLLLGERMRVAEPMPAAIVETEKDDLGRPQVKGEIERRSAGVPSGQKPRIASEPRSARRAVYLVNRPAHDRADLVNLALDEYRSPVHASDGLFRLVLEVPILAGPKQNLGIREKHPGVFHGDNMIARPDLADRELCGRASGDDKATATLPIREDDGVGSII